MKKHILLLDRLFRPVTMPLDGYFSLVWSLTYQACGTFAALLPALPVCAPLDTAVYLTDGERCGRIETVRLADKRAELRGRMLECLLYDRLLAEKYVYTGPLADACLHLVRTRCADLPVTVDPEGVVFPESGTYRGHWVTAGGWLHEVLSEAGGSYELRYVPGAEKCVFRLTCGTDRSGAGAVFSEDFGNIASLEIERDRTKCADRLYVTGADGTTVSVVRAGVHAPYRDARIEANDIESADFEVFADYTDALRARALAYLSENGGEIVRAEGCAQNGALPRYGTDYALGDLCTVCAPSMGYTGRVRLTRIDLVYENGVAQVYPYFGARRQTIRELLADK